jgi:hypothetical protein
MGWGRGPDEKRNAGAQARQYERDGKKMLAGDEKAIRINDRHSERTNDARREKR